MRPLFDIAEDVLRLGETLENAGGEFTEDEIGQELERWFDRLSEERDRKVNGICWLIQEFTARAEAREEAAKDLMARAGASENNAKRLKARLKLFLETIKVRRLDTEHFSPRIVLNSKSPLVFPDQWEREPASAPERYHRPVIELNKALIREDAEATEAELARLSDAYAKGEIKAEQYNDAMQFADRPDVARIGERGTHLRLR